MLNPAYGKLDPKVKTRWLKQLRSGDLVQRRGSLGFYTESLGTSFCCLGVLVDKCGIKGKLGGKWEAYGHLSLPDGSMTAEAKLTRDALDNVGMTHAAQDRLISMNDSEGASFEQIADWIEENL